MESKFSLAPCHEPESNDRVAATDGYHDSATKVTTSATPTATPTTDEHDDVSNVQSQYVIDKTEKHLTLGTNINISNVNNVNKDWIPKSTFKKQQNRIRKQRINIVFNYSKIQLTTAMTNVLNRGLNFCILPMKLDLT